MRYSWKAITCCVSKGMLVLLAIACALGVVGMCGWKVEQLQEQRLADRKERCDELAKQVRDGSEWVIQESDSWTVETLVVPSTPEAEALMARYDEECVPKAPRRMPDWAAPAAGGLLAFFIGSVLLAGVCGGNITYCQAAVETKRKPWYWLPWIGDPLPGREQVTSCEHCGSTRPETDDEYRARLGLPPLDRDA